MDKNTIIAFILIGVILLLWPIYMKKVVGVKENTPENVNKIAAQSDSVEGQGAGREEKIIAPEKNKRVKENIGQGSLIRLQSSRKPDTIKVSTDIFEGKISSQGGGTIVSWKLKEFYLPEGKERSKEFVELIPDSAVGNLSIIAGVDMSRLVFDVKYDTMGEDKRYIFSYRFKDGKKVEKEFIIRPDSYIINMIIRLSSFNQSDVGDRYSLQWRSGLEFTENERNRKRNLNYYQAWALQGGDEVLKTRLKNTGVQEGITNWAAVRTKYFLMAMIPKKPLGKAVRLSGRKVDNNKWKSFDIRIDMPFEGKEIETSEFMIYLGPMEYKHLKDVGVGLEKMMNFGWAIIKPFSIAFFYTFRFLYKIIGDYGWAIIIFAILIKIILYPLTRKSYKSMKQMQELQPQINALREKYKDDPQRLNQETMKLYKKHGVNPMGGCLPLLLQMPVLFALFNLFRTTIMLRQAGFLGLIKDLSSPDQILGPGINLLPILMGITMIIQQRLSTQNPQQKAMAFFMPIFFLFIFYSLSAGLNLYYLTFNILTIAQELVIKKHK